LECGRVLFVFLVAGLALRKDVNVAPVTFDKLTEKAALLMKALEG